MAVRFAVDAKGPGAKNRRPVTARLFTIVHYCSALFGKNIAAEPVSSTCPTFTVGLAVNANEPMLRKGNVLDCVAEDASALRQQTGRDTITPPPQGVLYGLAAAPIIGAFVTAISVIIAARPLPRFLSEWGLLKYRPWASMLGLFFRR